MKESFEALLDQLMSTGFFLEQAVEIIEKGMIERALHSTAANQCEASKLLGIHRNTLQRKMVQYSINGKRPRRRPAARAQAAGPSARPSSASKSTRRRSAS
jgi:DNA-binding NtrC family response regulator